jgi:hypothetical protein
MCSPFLRGLLAKPSTSNQRALTPWIEVVLRQQRGVQDQVVFIGIAQENAQTFSGRKEGNTFLYDRDKTVHVKQYYFYIDDEDFGPILLKVCNHAPWSLKLCLHINRRLLEIEGVSHNCAFSADSIRRVVQPTVTEEGKRATPGLKFGDPRVMALPVALSLFTHPIRVFRNRDLRYHVAGLLAIGLGSYLAAKMTYDLRHTRLKGLTHRSPRSHRYFSTPHS